MGENQEKTQDTAQKMSLVGKKLIFLVSKINHENSD